MNVCQFNARWVTNKQRFFFLGQLSVAFEFRQSPGVRDWRPV